MPDVRATDSGLLLEKIDVHDHVVLFFQTDEERDRCLACLVRTACRRNEACVFVTKRQHEEKVRDILVKAGLKRECLAKDGRITLIDPMEQFDGLAGDASLLLDMIGSAVDRLLDKGFTAVRLFNDMDRLNEVLPSNEVALFESLSNELYDEKKAVGICIVDVTEPRSNIMSAITTHPLMIIKGCVCSNHFYVRPEEYSRLNGLFPSAAFILDRLLEIQMSEVLTDGSEEDLRTLNARLQSEVERRKMVEWALLRSENDYRSALNAISDMMLVTDQANRVLIANSAFYDGLDTIGYDGNIIGEDLYDIMPFLRSAPSDDHDELRRSNVPSMTESTFSLNGREFTFEISKVPIADGDVVGRVLTTIRNVTGRAEQVADCPVNGDLTEIVMEQARELLVLKEKLAFEHERRRLAEGRILSSFRLLDSNKMPMFIWNANKRIVYANQAFLKYVGYGTGSLDGMGLYEVLVDEERDDHGSIVREFVEKNEVTFSAKVRMNGGSSRQSVITMVRFTESDGYTLTIVTDGRPFGPE